MKVNSKTKFQFAKVNAWCGGFLQNQNPLNRKKWISPELTNANWNLQNQISCVPATAVLQWSQIKHRCLKMGMTTGGEKIFAFFARLTSTPKASNMASEWRYFGLFL